MDGFAIVYRLMGVGLIAYWIVQLGITARRPRDWQLPGSERSPVRVTRTVWFFACVLGLVAGVGIVALSYVIFG